MLLTNILDSLTVPCMVYNTVMYTVYGWCGQYGQCMFIHWPVRPVWLVRPVRGYVYWMYALFGVPTPPEST